MRIREQSWLGKDERFVSLCYFQSREQASKRWVNRRRTERNSWQHSEICGAMKKWLASLQMRSLCQERVCAQKVRIATVEVLQWREAAKYPNQILHDPYLLNKPRIVVLSEPSLAVSIKHGLV